MSRKRLRPDKPAEPTPPAEQPLSPAQQRFKDFNDLAGKLHGIIRTIQDGRSRSLAITKLDELGFWATRGMMIDSQPPAEAPVVE